MDYLTGFINLFLVPFFSVWLLFRIQKKQLVASMETWTAYAILAAFNYPLTHIGVALARILKYAVALDSALYTLMALLSSVILALLAALIKAYIHVQFEVKKTDEK